MEKPSKKKKEHSSVQLVKKSNDLIEARYKFDVWETRVFLFIVSCIRREDQDFEPHRIRYSDLRKLFSLESQNRSYDLLRDAVHSLMKRQFFISYETEDGAIRETAYQVIRKADYLKKGQPENETNEYIDISIDPDMKPLLLQLQKNFTAYDLRNIAKLGANSVRLYELLKQYQSIGHRTLRIDDIKKMLELEDKYPNFGQFNQSFIKPAVKEINTNTDIFVKEIETIKESKKIVALCFWFRLKTDEELQKIRGEKTGRKKPTMKTLFDDIETVTSMEGTEKDVLFDLFFGDVVQGFGVTPSVLVKLLEEHPKDAIEKAVRVTKRAEKSKQIKTTVAGFFIQALKDGYTDVKEEQAAKNAQEEEKRHQKEAIQEKIDAIKDEYAVKINDRIKELVKIEPNATSKAIEALAKNPLYQSFIKKKEKALGRVLEVQDYREDKILREMVKTKLVELEQGFFADLMQQLNEAIEAVKK